MKKIVSNIVYQHENYDYAQSRKDELIRFLKLYCKDDKVEITTTSTVAEISNAAEKYLTPKNSLFVQEFIKIHGKSDRTDNKIKFTTSSYLGSKDGRSRHSVGE